jgi:DNA-binding response OmpR family regulator
MKQMAAHKTVLIIDRQDSWRDKAAAALRGNGYAVDVQADYDYTAKRSAFGGRPADLVILGCSRIKHEERELINNVLRDDGHLVVLCASLPWGDMRSLFLAGADDVVDDKPYDSSRLLNIIEEAFAGIGEDR